MSISQSPRLVRQRLIGALVMAALGLGLASAHAEAVVVVHASTTAALDDDVIAKIFLRQVKAFPDGSPATPVNQKDGPTSEDFRQRVLKKNGAQFKAFWAQQVFSGGSKPPAEVDGDEAVLKFVAETPGAIGYVEAGKSRSGVRLLRK